MAPQPPLTGKVSASDVAQAHRDARAHKAALRRAWREYVGLKSALLWATFVRRLRVLAGRFEGKPVFALILATACFGVLAPILVFCRFGLLGVLGGAGIGFLIGGVAAAALLYRPRDEVVDAWLAHLPAAVDGKADQLGPLRQQAREACELYRQLQQALSSRRNRLLRTEWRALTGIPFERFLMEVFEELGYAVENTKASGDQGVDLVLVRGGERIAVQAKGYAGSVGNSAVQEVFTGMHVYGCTQCAAVTNSDYTSGAREAAKATGCVLVAGGQIPDLIAGRIM